MPRAPRFFLSHSMLDASEVEKLHECIAALGVDVYLAEHDPQPGTDLAAKVITAIRASDAVLVFLTQSAAASPWVHQEIGVALNAEKLIVPIVQHGVDRSMGALAGLEWIDVDFGSPGDALRTVSESLEPLVRKHAAWELQRELEQQRAQEFLVALGLVAAILLIANSGK